MTTGSSAIAGWCEVTAVSGGWNVVGPTGPSGTPGCGLTLATDLTGTDPLLGALDDNGGPTPTHLPLAGSPLIDRIPLGTPVTCAATTDQRGRPVPAGAGCDVGAVEVQPPG